ncbi:T9SS type A sorting domain-containing protein [Calditrichota bacterium]
MKIFRLLVPVLVVAIFCITWAAEYTINNPEFRNELDYAEINIQNRVHRQGNIWMNITNYGFLGNSGNHSQNQLGDPETGGWAPQCEFPAGSGSQYLFQAGLWIGAIVETDSGEYPRVSHGIEGWAGGWGGMEMWPGYDFEDPGIIERSNRKRLKNYLDDDVYSYDAKASQEFIATFTDTSLVDPIGRILRTQSDGAHVPLGVKVTQHSMQWDASGFDDFIIIDYNIENIGSRALKNVYLGLLVDADIGSYEVINRHTDDLTGFLAEAEDEEWNIAYIFDNDGRRPDESAGTDFTGPAVAGTMILQSPNENLHTSFNWWLSNGDRALDYGPSWEDDGATQDSFRVGVDSFVVTPWTEFYGTPVSDAKKYFLMSNREQDFDQVYCADTRYVMNHSQEVFNAETGEYEIHDWKTDNLIPEIAQDFANGYDTKYLISWGPLGTDSKNDQGDFTLDSGEKVSLTIAYLLGDNFHDRNIPQPSNTNIDPSLFDTSGLIDVARRAKALFDSQYQSAPPSKPADVRIYNGFTGPIVTWPPYETLPGTKVNVYRRLQDGIFIESPVNPTPVAGCTYVDRDAEWGKRYLYKIQAVRFDSLYSLFSDEKSVLVGEPSAVYNLNATGGVQRITLTWSANMESGIDEYRIYRAEAVGLTDEYGDIEFIGVADDTVYVDDSIADGIKYFYCVSAVCSGLEGVMSQPSAAIAMGFENGLLVMREELGGVANWETDSLDAFYRALFEDVVNDPDFIVKHPLDDSLTLEELSSYRVVWITLDDVRQLSYSRYGSYMLQRNEMIATYLSCGGKVVISGLNLGLKIFNVGDSYWHYSYPFDSPLEEFFKIDSLFTYGFNFDWTPWDVLNSASPVQDSYPLLEVNPDSSKTYAGELIYRLTEITVIAASENSDILYEYISEDPASEYSLQGHSVGVLTSGEVEDKPFATALISFPLYAMEPYDSVSFMVEKVLADLDVEIDGTILGSSTTRDQSLIKYVYPNPSNMNTKVVINLSQNSMLRVSIFNIIGQEVAVITNNSFEAGINEFFFDASELSTGIYFIHASMPGKMDEVRKVVLIK